MFRLALRCVRVLRPCLASRGDPAMRAVSVIRCSWYARCACLPTTSLIALVPSRCSDCALALLQQNVWKAFKNRTISQAKACLDVSVPPSVLVEFVVDPLRVVFWSAVLVAVRFVARAPACASFSEEPSAGF